jgi:hypothetical protein
MTRRVGSVAQCVERFLNPSRRAIRSIVGQRQTETVGTGETPVFFGKAGVPRDLNPLGINENLEFFPKVAESAPFQRKLDTGVRFLTIPG